MVHFENSKSALWSSLVCNVASPCDFKKDCDIQVGTQELLWGPVDVLSHPSDSQASKQ